jgi:hypothetical protein
MDEPCEDTFLAIVRYHFIPLSSFGHFLIFPHGAFHAHMTGLLGSSIMTADMMDLELMRSPLATRFYEEAVNEDRLALLQNIIEELIEIYGQPYNHFRDGEDAALLGTTNIIEEGKIAYVSAISMDDLIKNRNQLRNFYTDIWDYEHLIIDLRGNPGGYVEYFIEILLRPLLNDTVEIPVCYYFYIDGRYVQRYRTLSHFPVHPFSNIAILESYRLVDEIIMENDLSELNLADMERLQYGTAVGGKQPLTPLRIAPHETDTVYSGKIWLLTDNKMASGAQLAAWLVKELELATLVGDITGGCMGGPRTMALMPNTGVLFQFDIFYMTDSRGRPLEAGTIPHHFNKEGMDALETALAMIEEGEY